MKQVTRGVGGTSAGTSVEANEEDFQVVPVESISEYEEHLCCKC